MLFFASLTTADDVDTFDDIQVPSKKGRTDKFNYA